MAHLVYLTQRRIFYSMYYGLSLRHLAAAEQKLAILISMIAIEDFLQAEESFIVYEDSTRCLGRLNPFVSCRRQWLI